MNTESTPPVSDQDENEKKRHPLNWESNHGLEVLSQVLWELGHPGEPEETLLEVIDSVHKKTGAYIINHKDAAAIISLVDELDFYDQQNLSEVRKSRIKAREKRQRENDSGKTNGLTICH
jgi:hypothetical protein|tara:strand:- start:2344 stop:2703 length:360 start_codon:yes stop_codon:yes gene_type:complete